MKFSQDNPVKIVMLGAGGTGGYIAPFLYRMASIADREIKTIICDGDKVELKNLVRQNFVYQDCLIALADWSVGVFLFE